MDMHQEVKAGDRDGQQQHPSRRVWEESGQDRRSRRRATRPPLEIKGGRGDCGSSLPQRRAGAEAAAEIPSELRTQQRRGLAPSRSESARDRGDPTCCGVPELRQ